MIRMGFIWELYKVIREKKGWIQRQIEVVFPSSNFIDFIMKSYILMWNCQGVGNPKFHIFLKEYLRDFDPDVVVLVETRISGIKAEKVIRNIGWLKSHRVEARGFSGRIWIYGNLQFQLKLKLIIFNLFI